MLSSAKKYLFFGLLTTSQAVSASEWTPTASAVNFLGFAPFGSQTGTIGIFEDTDDIALSLGPIAAFSNGATVLFAQNGSDWDITVHSMGISSVATLTGSNDFQLGWLSNGAWIPQTGNNANPWAPNIWQLTFIDSSLPFNNTQTLLATNIALSEAIPPSEVPLPAAAWSFMVGILGLLALGKRRTREEND